MEESKPPAQEKPCIVLVEDDDGQALLTARMLQKEGFHVRRESSARGLLSTLNYPADEMVLLHLASSTYFGLNPLGARIWQLLDTKRSRSLDDICRAVQAEYDVEEADLRGDLARFTQSLSAHGLIEVV